MSVQTIEEFWREVNGQKVVWRTARKPQWCGQCRLQVIDPGDRYLDTGEHIGVWKTSKCCVQCAGEPAQSERSMQDAIGEAAVEEDAIRRMVSLSDGEDD